MSEMEVAALLPDRSREAAARGARLRAATLYGTRSFLGLEEAWKELLALSSGDNPFLSWEWVSTWVRHFCGHELVTVVVYDGERIAAIAPFYRRRYHPFPGVRAIALELYGPRRYWPLFELRQVLLRPGDGTELLTVLLAHVATTAVCDWIEFATYGQGSAAKDALMDALPDGFAVELESEDPVPILPLAESWDAQRRTLKRNIKESIRHSYNSIERDGLEYEVLLGAEERSCADRVAAFIALHRSRAALTGTVPHTDQFAEAKQRAFLAHVAPRMMETGHLGFAEVRIAGSAAASRIYMDAPRCRYLYFSGFDPAWWRYGVMTLLVTECVKDAISRRRGAINFSPGGDQSKTRWGGTAYERGQYVLVRRSRGSYARRYVVGLEKRFYRGFRHALRRTLTASHLRRGAEAMR